MVLMKWTAWATLALSAIGLVMFMATEFAPMLGAAISLAIAGIVLLGFDRALCLLTEIKDGMVAQRVQTEASAGADHQDEIAPRDAATLGVAIAKKRPSLG